MVWDFSSVYCGAPHIVRRVRLAPSCENWPFLPTFNYCGVPATGYHLPMLLLLYFFQSLILDFLKAWCFKSTQCPTHITSILIQQVYIFHMSYVTFIVWCLTYTHMDGLKRWIHVYIHDDECEQKQMLVSAWSSSVLAARRLPPTHPSNLHQIFNTSKTNIFTNQDK